MKAVAPKAEDPKEDPKDKEAAGRAWAFAAATVASFADWVVASGDNEGLPFVVIDKIETEVFVFDPEGRMTGLAPVLIGLAHGDDSTPGVGDRELSNIRPEERTTPAGRFVAAFGKGPGKEDVLWVDYETAISMHPLRQVTLVDPRERRLSRLNSPTPKDNRITFGCINVPDAFFDEVIRPAFTGTKGVVYILPETRPLDDVFPMFERRPELVAEKAPVKPPPREANGRGRHKAEPG
ncbi:hypothetical protein [Caulobacter sp. 17J65-9]|uniref:hypothetical protein n=1 Tax=Caulobacter sp. 17J65-9 TaxID=2709382 RepID=UPI0013CCEBEA|nr:hypothetical protein [Caulobacter sp. 17J65-9]NEX91948.1 hypothetical protein [Caulobacter sp. 17J65-9]